jgi:hypothetical protein
MKKYTIVILLAGIALFLDLPIISGCWNASDTPTYAEITGVILSGGDTTPESGPLDTPRKYVYALCLESGKEIWLSYTAFPPSPVGDAARAKIMLDFYYGTMRQGDYVKAQGAFDPATNTVTVASLIDYIKTYAQKP